MRRGLPHLKMFFSRSIASLRRVTSPDHRLAFFGVLLIESMAFKKLQRAFLTFRRLARAKCPRVSPGSRGGIPLSGIQAEFPR